MKFNFISMTSYSVEPLLIIIDMGHIICLIKSPYVFIDAFWLLFNLDLQMNFTLGVLNFKHNTRWINGVSNAIPIEQI